MQELNAKRYNCEQLNIPTIRPFHLYEDANIMTTTQYAANAVKVVKHDMAGTECMKP